MPKQHVLGIFLTSETDSGVHNRPTVGHAELSGQIGQKSTIRDQAKPRIGGTMTSCMPCTVSPHL